MIVIDASAVLAILSRSEAGIELESRIPGVELHAPHLIDLEVVHTLRRWSLAGMISVPMAEAALRSFCEIPIERHAHTQLLDQVWSLRNNLTAYDAVYLALANLLGAELLTMDEGLRKAAARSRRAR
jgi:predicted nucleic acid-binding protein